MYWLVLNMSNRIRWLIDWKVCRSVERSLEPTVTSAQNSIGLPKANNRICMSKQSLQNCEYNLHVHKLISVDESGPWIYATPWYSWDEHSPIKRHAIHVHRTMTRPIPQHPLLSPTKGFLCTSTDENRRVTSKPRDGKKVLSMQRSATRLAIVADPNGGAIVRS